MAEPADTSSLLSHVSNLETEKKKLLERMQQQEQQLEKFTAEKREEMKKQFDTVILDWLKQIDVSDEKAREEFINGMQGMVKKTQQESPIWKMMCCASATHKRNVNELQRVQEEYNSLKSKVEGGSFRNEEARVGTKRVEPEPISRSSYWDDFETSVRGGAISDFVPDPDRIRDLRQDWKPLA